MSWDWEKLKEQQQHQRPGSGGPGNIPPQVDDLVKQFKNMKIPGGPLIAIAVILVLFIGYSIFFTIESGSVGVVQRFGKFIRIAQPGPNFKLPFGIEKVTKVRQDRIYKEEFGFRSSRQDNRSSFGGRQNTSSGVSLMLTTSILKIRVSPASGWLRSKVMVSSSIAAIRAGICWPWGDVSASVWPTCGSISGGT